MTLALSPPPPGAAGWQTFEPPRILPRAPRTPRGQATHCRVAGPPARRLGEAGDWEGSPVPSPSAPSSAIWKHPPCSLVSQFLTGPKSRGIRVPRQKREPPIHPQSRPLHHVNAGSKLQLPKPGWAWAGEGVSQASREARVPGPPGASVRPGRRLCPSLPGDALPRAGVVGRAGGARD